MTELFRYNLKKNVGILFNNKNNFINKFYINSEKKKNHQVLKNEFNGYSWYARRLKKKFNKNYLITYKNSFIRSPLIYGKKYKYWKDFIKKKDLINIIINHYKEIWPNKLKVPFHGDLSLDNIIFIRKKGVFFIDWEYYNKEEEWGLDLCYFLISIIVLPNINQKRINDLDLKLFLNFWKKIFNNKNYNYLNNPFEYITKKKIDKNSFFFKINSEIKNQIINKIKE